MKTSKLVLTALAILATLSLVPLSSLSKETTSADTVVVSSKNMLLLNQEVTGESVAEVINKAAELDSKLPKGKPLYLVLNTPGGSVQSGLELIEALKGLGRPINTVVMFAASMGFQICQNLDTRYILKNGILMSHRAAGEIQGQFGGPSPSQMESRYNFWLRRTVEMDEVTVARTKGKQTLKSYQEAYANELWVTGDQALAGGYADTVTKLRCDASLNGVTTHETSFLGMPVYYDLSNCPINTSPINVRIGGTILPLSPSYSDHLKKEFLSNYVNNMTKVVDKL